jgi:hypothetical protein
VGEEIGRASPGGVIAVLFEDLRDDSPYMESEFSQWQLIENESLHARTMDKD